MADQPKFKAKLVAISDLILAAIRLATITYVIWCRLELLERINAKADDSKRNSTHYEISKWILERENFLTGVGAALMVVDIIQIWAGSRLLLATMSSENDLEKAKLMTGNWEDVNHVIWVLTIILLGILLDYIGLLVVILYRGECIFVVMNFMKELKRKESKQDSVNNLSL